MPTTFIPFDGWSPSGGYFGEGWNSATNLYQFFGSWRPWRKFAPFAASVADGPMVGRHVHAWNTAPSGSYVPDAATVFTGSPTKLYTVSPITGAFTDRSRGGGYTVDSAGWRFVTIGNDIWATNWWDPMQRRANNAGNFADGVTSTFKPIPRFMRAVREHLVVANLLGGRFQDEVAWSDANDPLNFDPAAAGSTSTSIAGAKRLVSIPGQITGLVGGQYVLIFKSNGIFYGEYTGGPSTFRFDVLSPYVGTALPSSIVETRYGVMFLGGDGFYAIAGLAEPAPISTPEINRFLLDAGFLARDPSGTVIRNEDQQMIGFQVPGIPMVGWAYRPNWNTDGAVLALLYNPVTSQWASVQVADDAPLDVSSVVNLPYSSDIYSATAALVWDRDAGLSRYAQLSSGSSVWPPAPSLNFRPTFDDSMPRQGQSQLKSVLPVFSKTSVSGTALTESVTVEALIDPHNGIWKTETSLSANRDTISGAYPFQIAGRFFRISIACAAEDFGSFEGAFITQEALK